MLMLLRNSDGKSVFDGMPVGVNAAICAWKNMHVRSHPMQNSRVQIVNVPVPSCKDCLIAEILDLLCLCSAYI